MKKITTVILAAGKSTRFKHKKSKIFQDLAGIEIISHIYSSFSINPKGNYKIIRSLIRAL